MIFMLVTSVGRAEEIGVQCVLMSGIPLYYVASYCLGQIL